MYASRYRLDGTKPIATPIRIGLTDGRRTQVVEGDVTDGTALIVDAKGQGGAS